MPRALVVGNRAEADLGEIWADTFEHWGEAQADRDLDALDDVARHCGAEPERGRRREDVRPGYWSRLARRHVVFYAFDDDEVVVRRVLHVSMDPKHRLSDG